MIAPLILIVEDEKKIADVIQDYLLDSGYRTRVFNTGKGVVDWVRDNAPDLLLLDIMLPGTDGLTLCREVRAISNVPVVMVTARVEEIDRLLGLELGADDYVCKPFSPRELVARIKAVLRRTMPLLSAPASSLTMDEPLTIWGSGFKAGEPIVITLMVTEVTEVIIGGGAGSQVSANSSGAFSMSFDAIGGKGAARDAAPGVRSIAAAGRDGSQ